MVFKIVIEILKIILWKYNFHKIDFTNDLLLRDKVFKVDKEISELTIKKDDFIIVVTNKIVLLFLINSLKNKYSDKNFVIISPTEMDLQFTGYAKFLTIQDFVDRIDYDKLELMSKIEDELANIDSDSLNSLDKSILMNLKELFTFDLSEEEFSNESLKNYNSLKSDVRTDMCSLFLGNGISLDFGASGWDRLVNDLFDYLNPIYVDNIDKVKKVIGNNNYSNTLIVKDIFPKYYKALYNCIYKKYTDIHSNNSTMRAVTELIFKKDNIRIITYNYDEFLERDIRKFTKRVIPVSVYSNGVYPNINSDNNKDNLRIIRINHVHGFIPYKSSAFDENMKKSIVLNQLDYFALYDNPQIWANKIQIDSLNSNVSVFVGSSLSDIFLVKLLKQTKGVKYVFFKDENLTTKDKYSIYRYYLNFNVKIIWCCSYKEMSAKIVGIC